MGELEYERGRLNLPFVGHATFAKAPVCVDWDAIDGDIAVVGVPNDMGTQYRSGARFGPRAIREAQRCSPLGTAGPTITRTTSPTCRLIRFGLWTSATQISYTRT